MSLNEKMTGFANKLREKTGVSNKISIVDMTKLLDNLKWGKENLLKGSNNQFKYIPLSGWGQISSATNNQKLDISKYPVGTSFTYSLTVVNKGNNNIALELSLNKADGTRMYQFNSNSQIVGKSNNAVNLTATIVKQDNAASLNAWIIGVDDSGNGSQIGISNERLYVGTEPGTWTPNPADKVGGVTDPTLITLPLYEEVAA